MKSNLNSFPLTARLTTPDEYKAVFDGAKKLHLAEFTVFCRKSGNNIAKLGLAVSKKVDKRAVVRNRIKRVIRESFRIHKNQLSGLEIVILSKPASKNLENKQLTELLESVWKKIGLKCAK